MVDVVKCSSKLVVYNKDRISYTIIIENNEQEVATDVIIKDFLPTGTTYIKNTFTVDGVVISNVDLVTGVNIGDVNVGSLIEVNLEVLVQAENTPIILTNIATLAYNYSGGQGTANSNEELIFVANGATQKQLLNFINYIAERFAVEVCDIVIPQVKEKMAESLGDAIQLIEDKLCRCENKDIVSAEALCEHIKVIINEKFLKCYCCKNKATSK
jgi:uncharacterized repeat protein (TIGR01451 family)